MLVAAEQEIGARAHLPQEADLRLSGRAKGGQRLGWVERCETRHFPPIEPAHCINLKTAKTLGLTVPPLLLATADEVID
jgi:hypothetical protein